MQYMLAFKSKKTITLRGGGGIREHSNFFLFLTPPEGEILDVFDMF